MKFKRNTEAIVQLATEKSRQARVRVIAALTAMQAHGAAINFNTVCQTARVSKTFLYDPKHADLAEQIRSLRQANTRHGSNGSTNQTKSDTAKDAQIIRFKEKIRNLEDRVRTLQDENELLYGKLSQRTCRSA